MKSKMAENCGFFATATAVTAAAPWHKHNDHNVNEIGRVSFVSGSSDVSGAIAMNTKHTTRRTAIANKNKTHFFHNERWACAGGLRALYTWTARFVCCWWFCTVIVAFRATLCAVRSSTCQSDSIRLSGRSAGRTCLPVVCLLWTFTFWYCGDFGTAQLEWHTKKRRPQWQKCICCLVHFTADRPPASQPARLQRYAINSLT